MLIFAIIALGANLPVGKTPPETNVSRAIKLLKTGDVNILGQSALYHTPAFPDPSAPPYVNACVTVQTRLDARGLLAHLHAIEDELGRVRQQRWGARIIDLDLLSFGAAVLPDPATYHHWASLAPEEQMARTPDRLVLPHPRIADRSFVLVPLAEIAPLWCHPVTGLSVTEMLKARPKEEIEAIQRLSDANPTCQAAPDTLSPQGSSLS